MVISVFLLIQYWISAKSTRWLAQLFVTPALAKSDTVSLTVVMEGYHVIEKQKDTSLKQSRGNGAETGITIISKCYQE